jgi:aspartyl-tRNA(Asn)/glutamyl-tRNA(Gln) amidotransferase subunit C
MSRTLEEAEVLKIASLARLALSADDVKLFTRQLGEILRYADQLQEVDTSGVEPTSHPLAAGSAWRDDEPLPSLDRGQLLEAAPSASPAAGVFKVPKVL